ncbi:MAG: endonuclease [Psychroserpens sp.]|nr:endonuclease [Psychroserpens sp.]MBO6654187.1 endonuclease [Psychroserpens sp.]MBO6682527.1 endonuclease [Psychroserpens sp.]MBO6750813.1 endonuclease [Psychroserpens sp.]MBO6915758.1 endonuclease [Psychroserpens sp.]
MTVSAQVPAGYYDYATGTGYTLKTQLFRIINNVDDPEINNTVEEVQTVETYNSLDGFNATYERDFYYEPGGSNTILDMYSENPTGADPYNYTPITDECGNFSSEGDCYNKEHIIPQSVFSSQLPMYSDAHHLIPSDGRVNGFRSNFPFGNVDDSQLTSQSGITNPTQNGSKLGGYEDLGYPIDYTGTVFEPIDEFKGDIARIYFYFVTRYETQVSGWSSYPMFDGSSDQAIAEPFLSLLIDWHLNDPVSQKEIDRNNNIFYNHQNNRNPFVDHPEWVVAIWSSNPDTEAPSDVTDLMASNPTDTTVQLQWTAATDNIGVSSYDIYVDGANTYNTSNTMFTATDLSPDTNYCFTLKALDGSGNESNFSNQACEMTTNNGGSGDIDIFFSEYIEGSSNNKVLEIANFTGATVNMSIYTLKLSFNGNANWSTTYTFPPSTMITNGDVYVIANGSSTVCTSEYDNLNNAITSFNGNDAIGLFKNDVLIDILGDFNSSSNYAQNTTLVRKPEVDRPTITFDINEWNSFGTNNCDDLGQHNQTLGTPEASLSAVTMYPNPLNGNTLFISTNENLNVEIYDVLGKRMLTTSVSSDNNTIDVSNLKSGLYLVRIISDNRSITKKLIKQ